MPHDLFMSSALSKARQAFEKGEVPIGAVIVCGNQIIAQAFNTCEADHDALAHAELKVIREASRIKGNWRLNDCTLYVTLEPCPMCLGALFQARVEKLVFGCCDEKRRKLPPLPTRGERADSAAWQSGERGVFPSLANTASLTDNNHTLSIVGGVMEKECVEILKDFFKSKRNQK